MKSKILLLLLLCTPSCVAQEMKVKWRQINIGSYTVTWPSSQSASGQTQCLTNDGTGAMAWGTCGSGSGEHPDPHLLGNGTSTAPSYSFSNSANSGLWYDGTDTVLNSTSAYASMRLRGTVASGSAIRLTDTGNVGVDVVSYKNYAPGNLSEKGKFYLWGNDVALYSTDGTDVTHFQLLPTYATISGTSGSTKQLRLEDGTSAAPIFTFVNSTGAGMYKASNTLGFKVATDFGGVSYQYGNSTNPLILYAFSEGAGGLKITAIKNHATTPDYGPLSYVGEYHKFYTVTDSALGFSINSQHVDVGGDTSVSDLRFLEASGNGANYVGFKAAAALSADNVWVLPTADGTSGQSLVTDGSGNLSFSTVLTGAHPDPHRLGNGTTTAPTYSFSSDTSMGMFRAGSQILAFSTTNNGGWFTLAPDGASGIIAKLQTSTGTGSAITTLRSEFASGNGMTALKIQATKVISEDGTAAAPTYGFTSETNLGMYRVSSNVLGLRASDGTALLTEYNNYSTDFKLKSAVGGYGNRITSLDSGDVVVPLEMNISRFLSPDGTAANPTYGFTSETNLGMYRSGAGELSLRALDGTVVLTEYNTYSTDLILKAAVGNYGNRISSLDSSNTIRALGINASALTIPNVTQANMGSPGNGSMVYCTDCTNTCAGSGTGAMAFRINSGWICHQ